MKNAYCATGRRKEATATVWLKAGSGKIRINRRDVKDYFRRKVYEAMIMEPLRQANLLGRFDVEAKVRGGGMTGQAGAIQLGLARAILKVNPDFRKTLKKAGLLTRDPRMKERKKPGLRGARARPQSPKR
ncbi:30S ribosomal protein S9 [Candidatus Aerophobetes bacterium]|uniref:Small ribosomal subunit protein uS9 n=1 Tax=Aerophobetes bacterium TaxID=2030807 RepID=A0A497E519_UNCAE|nr:30S ribosomal protein S9 [Candidatus Aerophobetes bacterium]RLE10152.1 MAG: 30S ribosomal protein S9 [Candidatus Aerophobetes bacterium]